MESGKRTDILLNIITPLTVGALTYLFKNTITLPVLLKNHLADGLWAYAFISTILIIWDRTLKTAWILAIFFISICFELLQYLHIIAGTGDIYDIITYFIFFIVSLLLNRFFKTKFYTKTLNDATH